MRSFFRSSAYIEHFFRVVRSLKWALKFHQTGLLFLGAILSAIGLNGLLSGGLQVWIYQTSEATISVTYICFFSSAKSHFRVGCWDLLHFVKDVELTPWKQLLLKLCLSPHVSFPHPPPPKLAFCNKSFAVTPIGQTNQSNQMLQMQQAEGAVLIAYI